MEHFWSQAASSSQPPISHIRRRLPHFPSAPLRIQRVSQVDAELLDLELTTLLLEPVKASLARIRSTLPDSLEPELVALLKLLLFKYSIWHRGASYGAMLQNLKYRNEWAHRGGLQSTFLSAPLSKAQLLLHPVLTIGIPYLHQRFHRRMAGTNFSDLQPADPRRLIWSVTDRLQRTYEALALVNFVAFLSDGKYRTVTDRLLGMRLTYAQRTLNRNVSFEFLNRQLVWHAFTEFLLFLMPIIRPRRLLRRLMRLPAHPRILSFWLLVLPLWLSKSIGLHRDSGGRPRYRLLFQIPLLTPSKQASLKDAASKGVYADLPREICPICWQRIETESSSTSSGALAVGIPTSDPLDPSSSALAPASSSAASRHGKADTRMQRYHSASRQFGVAPNGVPYSVALLHTPYKATPCGCRYCYVCLASKLLSEEAGEELDDSRSAAGVQTRSSSSSRGSAVGGEKNRRKRSDVPADATATVDEDDGDDDGIGAWDCLRCARKVKGMQRAMNEEGEGQGDAEQGKDGPGEEVGGAGGRRAAITTKDTQGRGKPDVLDKRATAGPMSRADILPEKEEEEELDLHLDEETANRDDGRIS